MKLLLLLAMSSLTWSVPPSAQIVGSCPPLTDRKPEKVTELEGVVVDENLAVVPKVQIKLQESDGRAFRDVAAVETDPGGRFSFASQKPGHYQLVVIGPKGLCPATVPVTYSNVGLKGVRLILPTGATDTCQQYCATRLKIEEMNGREGRE